LPEDAVDNFLCGDGLAVAQAPVIWIDALAHDEITHLLRHGKLHDLLRKLRLVINAVRRRKQDRLYSERAFNQALRQIQLPADFRGCDVVELWMGEGMIANFVPSRTRAGEYPAAGWPCCRSRRTRRARFSASKCPRPSGSIRIGAIVKGKGDFLVRGADLVNV